jgi:transcriptional regulator with XRE-family HTH domain
MKTINIKTRTKIQTTFSENLRRLRKNKDLTQTELAACLKLQRTSIANFESGFCEPNLDILYNIGIFFNVNISQLLSATNIVAQTKKENGKSSNGNDTSNNRVESKRKSSKNNGGSSNGNIIIYQQSARRGDRTPTSGRIGG